MPESILLVEVLPGGTGDGRYTELRDGRKRPNLRGITMRAGQDRGALTAEQEFARLTIERLRPLAALLGSAPPKKKGELVAVLTRAMTDPARARSLYDRLEPVAQLAVREATHD